MGSNEDEDVTGMHIKCSATRFLFIDEIEATGAETIGDLEFNTKTNVDAKSFFKYFDDRKQIRRFGGINVCLFRVFWQLKPTGGFAFMSNPYADGVLQSASASRIMSMVWDEDHPDAIEKWAHNERAMHLSVNFRSGADQWFSHVLDACRSGKLEEDDYNFLHGYPTITKISFWYDRKDDEGWNHSQRCEHRATGSLVL